MNLILLLALALPGDFTARVKVGQTVNVTDADGRYTIMSYVGGPEKLSHSVTEVAPDYIVVRDIVGMTDAAIPVWSIKAIIVVRIRRTSAKP